MFQHHLVVVASIFGSHWLEVSTVLRRGLYCTACFFYVIFYLSTSFTCIIVNTGLVEVEVEVEVEVGHVTVLI